MTLARGSPAIFRHYLGLPAATPGNRKSCGAGYLGLSEAIWNYLGLPGNICNHLELPLTLKNPGMYSIWSYLEQPGDTLGSPPKNGFKLSGNYFFELHKTGHQETFLTTEPLGMVLIGFAKVPQGKWGGFGSSLASLGPGSPWPGFSQDFDGCPRQNLNPPTPNCPFRWPRAAACIMREFCLTYVSPPLYPKTILDPHSPDPSTCPHSHHASWAIKQPCCLPAPSSPPS